MLNIKQSLNQIFKSLALASLLVALMGAFLASPMTASAIDEACVYGMRPEQCGYVGVTVVDQQTGQTITNASVWAVHETGYIAKLDQSATPGFYSAALRPGIWKIYAEAPAYDRFETSLNLEPADKEEVKAPLPPNSRTAPGPTSGLASSN